MNNRWKCLVFGFLLVLAACRPDLVLILVSPTPEPEKTLTTPASQTSIITRVQTVTPARTQTLDLPVLATPIIPPQLLALTNQAPAANSPTSTPRQLPQSLTSGRPTRLRW